MYAVSATIIVISTFADYRKYTCTYDSRQKYLWQFFDGVRAIGQKHE